MKDAWRWQELRREFRHPVPCSVIALAALYKRAPPEINHIVPESPEAFAVSRYCVIREVSADDLSQPLSLYRDRFVHAPPQLLFDRSQPCPHPVPARLPLELKGAPGDGADSGEGAHQESAEVSASFWR